ncbi:MAG: peptide/nickel transport system permease protein [Actinomycetota bacterium]|nr:peptide/nickel transport system permease protein [Actinomycetota bacterium]
MLRFVIRRLITSVLILAVVSAVTFFLFFAIPSDPGRLSCGKICAPSTLAEIHHNLGLDRPVIVQYGDYMKGIVVGRDFTEHGDKQHCPAPCFGYSFVNHQPVWQTFLDRFPATASLAIGAALLFLVGGVTLGLISAVNRGKAFDKIAIGLSLTGASLQIYFIGVVARAFFVDKLRWLPQPGYTPLTQDPVKWASGLLLPWLVLAFVSAALYARLSRASMVEALQEDFVRTGRARGLSARSIYLKHAGRAAISPVVTVFGLDLAGLLGGAIITESVFSIQGVGRLAITSVFASDLPMIMATVLLAAVVIVIANLIVDIAYALIDPRVRIS